MSQQGAEMIAWIGLGAMLLGIGYYIMADWLLSKHRQERQRWIDEIRSHSAAWDEFAATWKYGAHEEAIDGMCRFLATCTRPGMGHIVPNTRKGKRMRADAALPMESSTRIVTSCVVAVHVLPHGKGLPLPRYESAGAAGLDLCAAGFDGERLAEYTLQPGHRVLVNCGIAIAIPVGFEGHIRARSGLACEFGGVFSEKSWVFSKIWGFFRAHCHPS